MPYSVTNTRVSVLGGALPQVSYFQSQNPTDMIENETWFNPDDGSLCRFIDGAWVERVGHYEPFEQQRCLVVKQAIISGKTYEGLLYAIRQRGSYYTEPFGGSADSGYDIYMQRIDGTLSSALFYVRGNTSGSLYAYGKASNGALIEAHVEYRPSDGKDTTTYTFESPGHDAMEAIAFTTESGASDFDSLDQSNMVMLCDLSEYIAFPHPETEKDYILHSGGAGKAEYKEYVAPTGQYTTFMKYVNPERTEATFYVRGNTIGSVFLYAFAGGDLLTSMSSYMGDDIDGTAYSIDDPEDKVMSIIVLTTQPEMESVGSLDMTKIIEMYDYSSTPPFPIRARNTSFVLSYDNKGDPSYAEMPNYVEDIYTVSQGDIEYDFYPDGGFTWNAGDPMPATVTLKSAIPSDVQPKVNYKQFKYNGATIGSIQNIIAPNQLSIALYDQTNTTTIPDGEFFFATYRDDIKTSIVSNSSVDITSIKKGADIANQISGVLVSGTYTSTLGTLDNNSEAIAAVGAIKQIDTGYYEAITPGSFTTTDIVWSSGANIFMVTSANNITPGDTFKLAGNDNVVYTIENYMNNRVYYHPGLAEEGHGGETVQTLGLKWASLLNSEKQADLSHIAEKLAIGGVTSVGYTPASGTEWVELVNGSKADIGIVTNAIDTLGNKTVQTIGGDVSLSGLSSDKIASMSTLAQSLASTVSGAGYNTYATVSKTGTWQATNSGFNEPAHSNGDEFYLYNTSNQNSWSGDAPFIGMVGKVSGYEATGGAVHTMEIIGFQGTSMKMRATTDLDAMTYGSKIVFTGSQQQATWHDFPIVNGKIDMTAWAPSA